MLSEITDHSVYAALSCSAARSSHSVLSGSPALFGTIRMRGSLVPCGTLKSEGLRPGHFVITQPMATAAERCSACVLGG